MKKILVGILLLFCIYGETQTSVIKDLRKFWLEKNIHELRVVLANEVRIYIDGHQGNYLRLKAVDVLQRYFANVEVVDFRYDIEKTRKDRIVVHYKYRKKQQDFTTTLYFFTSYNAWSDIILIESIRQIPKIETSKKIKPQQKSSVGNSKQSIIEKYGDPQLMQDDIWEYTRTFSIGCHNVYHIKKYIFKEGRVIKTKEEEISMGCEVESLW